EQDRAAQAPTEELIGTTAVLPNPSNRQEDGEDGTACDDPDTDGIDRLADSLDDLDDRHAVMVSPTPQLSGRHAGGGGVDHAQFDVGIRVVAVAAGIPQSGRGFGLGDAGIVPGAGGDAQRSGSHVDGGRPTTPCPPTGCGVQVSLAPASAAVEGHIDT